MILIKNIKNKLNFKINFGKLYKAVYNKRIKYQSLSQ